MRKRLRMGKGADINRVYPRLIAYKRRMAKSELRTKVAILRAAIGISMKEFAALTGRTFYTWKALESDRLKLSEELAAIISEKTGVALSWLLDASIKGPPIGQSGEPFTRKEFEYYQAKVMAGAIPSTPDKAAKSIALNVDMFRQTLESAYLLSDEANFILLLFRVGKILKELEQEFIWDAAERKHKKDKVMSKSQSAESKRKRGPKLPEEFAPEKPGSVPLIRVPKASESSKSRRGR